MNGDFLNPTELLWRPLFEAAAQTLVGAMGAYSFGKLVSKVTESNHYEGGMDLWVRGIRSNKVSVGDAVVIDGLISPYVQLFPGDPTENAKRWNSLHSFSGRISSAQYQSLEFFAGSDASLRIGSINGESIVGIYNRYGFIGEGLIGVAPTKLLTNSVPGIFEPNFVGAYARISGIISECPSQHAFVAGAIASSSDMPFDVKRYRHLPYLQINRIKLCSAPKKKQTTLLGSVWIATHVPTEQYVTEYGYLNNEKERQDCVTKLYQSKVWNKASVFFDDIACPSRELSFKKMFF